MVRAVGSSAIKPRHQGHALRRTLNTGGHKFADRKGFSSMQVRLMKLHLAPPHLPSYHHLILSRRLITSPETQQVLVRLPRCHQRWRASAPSAMAALQLCNKPSQGQGSVMVESYCTVEYLAGALRAFSFESPPTIDSCRPTHEATNANSHARNTTHCPHPFQAFIHCLPYDFRPITSYFYVHSPRPTTDGYFPLVPSPCTSHRRAPSYRLVQRSHPRALHRRVIHRKIPQPHDRNMLNRRDTHQPKLCCASCGWDNYAVDAIAEIATIHRTSDKWMRYLSHSHLASRT